MGLDEEVGVLTGGTAAEEPAERRSTRVGAEGTNL